MSEVLENLYYSETHEWIRLEDENVVTIGVTDHAQNSMGDMVYVDLPEVGDNIDLNGECGVLESVKSASDLYAPVAGEVVEVNEALVDAPDLVNKDPYGDGWILKMKLEDNGDLEKLMNPEAYRELLDVAE